MQKGKASLQFEHPVYIAEAACIAGKKEGDGPLADTIDRIEADPMFGKNTWEEAESTLQRQTVELTLKKSGLMQKDIRYLFAGDLLGQLIATSFGLVDLDIPLFGIYGACSTIGEALQLGSICVDAGHAERILAVASSHFATAEKQFRFPLGYGNQRPQSTTWTVTGCGAVILSSTPADNAYRNIRITGITTGTMTDLGTKDSMNMGAAMAPSAWSTIMQNFRDFDVSPAYYDQIITGDLGKIGSRILNDFMRNEGYSIEDRHMDCGLEIFHNAEQDTHSGGSGCGCAAVTLCAYILPRLADGTWKRVLFLPTGALLSTTSYNEGQSIPGIAHAVILENCLS